MAGNTQLSVTAQNVQLNALATLANSGYIRIYNGTQPAAGGAITTQTLLAELRFGNPAFGASSNGIITANAITSDASADATGTATWFRVLQSDGTTILWDGNVGTSGANMNMSSTSISAGTVISITGFTFTLPSQGS